MTDIGLGSKLAARGQISRREVLKKGLIGAAGLTILPSVIAACTSATATATGGSSTTKMAPLTGTLHVGSNHSDPSELKGMQDINAAFAAATGLTPTLNTVDHNTFQD
jgi:multiple sugar transport system substrate-binding protein